MIGIFYYGIGNRKNVPNNKHCIVSSEYTIKQLSSSWPSSEAQQLLLYRCVMP
jgi:hypothetical protein